MCDHTESKEQGITIYSLAKSDSSTVWISFGSDEYQGDTVLSVHRNKEKAIDRILKEYPDSPHYGVVREMKLED